MPNNVEYIGKEYLKGIRKSAPFVVDGDVIGVPFNLQQVIDRYGKEIIPDELGIYHLFYEDQLVYIGMSKSIRGRLRQHLKDKDMPFNNVLWFCSSNWKEGAPALTIEQTLEVEYQMIKHFKPVLNSMHANCR
jgi:excinuclease UvrABC nuclease subunit